MIYLREYVLEKTLRRILALNLGVILHRPATEEEIDAIFGKEFIETERILDKGLPL